MARKGTYRLNSTRLVVGSFLLVILVGALLLGLPISNRSGTWGNPLTALFTATSATCVTGLVLADTWLNWSLFGQVVILLLIQIGGLGFMTMLTMVSLATRRRISLSQRMIMTSALNLDEMQGVVRMVRHAIALTAILEGGGALLLMARFIPQFGWAGGAWRSVFTSVSAFCNAGFDLMGRNGAFSSMTGYVTDPYVNIILMALILSGGLGFFVWEEVLHQRRWKKFSLYTRLAIKLTGGFLAAGWLCFALIEWNNPDTLGELTSPQKLLAALFQSVTLRTAGFNTIDQGGLREVSKVISSLLMTAGGCSGSTAGGVKLVTLWVLLHSLQSGMRGEEKVTYQGRTIPNRKVMDALHLVLMVLLLELAGALLLCGVEQVPFVNALYEVCSAMGTAGMSTGITTTLTTGSKLLLIGLMFLGRVGILSAALAFLTQKRGKDQITYPDARVMIG